jgi:hypothetical protein
MTALTFIMKGDQQRHGDILVGFQFMATGTLAAFAEISVGEHIKIMVADSAAQLGLVQIVIEFYHGPLVLSERPAFQVHDSFLNFSFLGPCQGCSYYSQT